MYFYTKQTIPPIGNSDIVCRIALWGPALSLIIFSAAFCFGIFLIFISYQSSTVWGMILSSLFTLFLLFVWGMVFQSFKATCSAANWLVRVGPAGILFKYRSYLHDDLPEEDPIALLLSWHEIADTQLQKEIHVTTDSNEKSQYNRWFLNIKVDPRYLEIDKINSALAFEHNRKPAHFKILDLSRELMTARRNKAAKTEITRLKQELTLEKRRHNGKSTVSFSRFHDRPVTFNHPDTLRMEWTHITPGKRKLRKILANFSNISDGQAQLIDITSRMTEQEFKALLTTLVSRDESLEAIKLIRNHLGCSIVEAKSFIEKLKRETTQTL